jgi:hypothetical protein
MERFMTHSSMTALSCSSVSRGLAECEGKYLNRCIEKLNLELPLHDGSRLPDQLKQALLGHCAIALGIYV